MASNPNPCLSSRSAALDAEVPKVNEAAAPKDKRKPRKETTPKRPRKSAEPDQCGDEDAARANKRAKTSPNADMAIRVPADVIGEDAAKALAELLRIMHRDTCINAGPAPIPVIDDPLLGKDPMPPQDYENYLNNKEAAMRDKGIQLVPYDNIDRRRALRFSEDRHGIMKIVHDHYDAGRHGAA
jgi:hypothetical protein